MHTEKRVLWAKGTDLYQITASAANCLHNLLALLRRVNIAARCHVLAPLAHASSREHLCPTSTSRRAH